MYNISTGYSTAYRISIGIEFVESGSYVLPFLIPRINIEWIGNRIAFTRIDELEPYSFHLANGIAYRNSMGFMTFFSNAC